jgi:hypothetical protein
MQQLSSWRIWLPFYVLLALASGFTDLRVRRYPEHAVKVYMPGVIDGTADAPGLYRVLAPFSFEWLAQSTGADRMVLWHATRLAWFFLAWLVWHVYLRTWFEPGEAMLGTAFVAATLPLTFTNSWPHPDHIPELALFTLGCLAIARQKDAWFAATLAVAAFNRETAAFLVPLYLVVGPLTRARLLRTAAFGALWLAIFAGLRWYRGFRMYDVWQFGRNLDFLKLLPAPYDPYYRAYAWFSVVLFGILLYLALRSRGRQPLFVRRALWALVPVFLVGWTISSIMETRIFTPAFSLVIPGVLYTLLRPITDREVVSGTR